MFAVFMTWEEKCRAEDEELRQLLEGMDEKIAVFHDQFNNSATQKRAKEMEKLVSDFDVGLAEFNERLAVAKGGLADLRDDTKEMLADFKGMEGGL